MLSYAPHPKQGRATYAWSDAGLSPVLFVTLHLLSDVLENISVMVPVLELALDFFLVPDGYEISYLPIFPVMYLGLASGLGWDRVVHALWQSTLGLSILFLDGGLARGWMEAWKGRWKPGRVTGRVDGWKKWRMCEGVGPGVCLSLSHFSWVWPLL